MMAGRATKGGLPGAYVLRGFLPVVAAADAFSEVNKVPLARPPRRHRAGRCRSRGGASLTIPQRGRRTGR